jgi:hypothetical protein
MGAPASPARPHTYLLKEYSMTERSIPPLEDSWLGIDLTEAHARRREEFLPFEEQKRIRHERFLASQQQQQKEQVEQKTKLTTDQLKKVLASADPKTLSKLSAFIEKLEEADYAGEYEADESAEEEEADIEELTDE